MPAARGQRRCADGRGPGGDATVPHVQPVRAAGAMPGMGERVLYCVGELGPIRVWHPLAGVVGASSANGAATWQQALTGWPVGSCPGVQLGLRAQRMGV